jgi:predicted O-methyltransferase YrrM
VASAVEEISSQVEFLNSTIGKLPKDANWYQVATPIELYAICRVTRPLRVLETGVASGLSSAFILKALETNGKGQLFSIDLPEYIERTSTGQLKRLELRPDGREPGWLVPEHLRRIWDLRVGRSQDLMAALLTELGDVDLFFHDSDHSYEVMVSEFQTAWPKLVEGGIMLADDIHCNNSFYDFAASVERIPVLVGGYRFGGIMK